MALDDLLLNQWNVLLMAATWSVMIFAERALPEAFAPGAWANRLEPMFPLAVCTAAATFVPGPWMSANVTWAQRLVLGVILGTAAYNFGGIAKRLGLTKVLTGVSTSAAEQARQLEKDGGK